MRLKKELLTPLRNNIININSYVARNSFVNCLKQKGVATEIISESLGHQNLAVTQTYLKALDSAVLDGASELLL